MLVVLLIEVLLALNCQGEQHTPVKFPKDQQLDVRFPPKIELPSSPGLPIGHLRPLGHQRRSSGEVAIQDISNGWNSTKPTIFKQLQKTKQQIWPRQNVEKNDDGSPVLVAKRSSSGATTQYHIEKLSKFLKNYGSEEWLLDQILDQKYLHNIKMPQGYQCLSDKVLFISSTLTSGTTSDDIKVSKLHKLQCVLSGRRDYIILKKGVTTLATVALDNPQKLCGFESIAELNPDLVNVFDNPWIISMNWQHATLRTGDCILIPADSPVHTTSYGDCETVTFNWQAKTDDCHDGINEKKELSPFLCFNGTNQKVGLCNYSQLPDEKRWKQLLISITDENDILTQSCISSIFSEKTIGERLYPLFGTKPVTREVIEKLPNSTLRQMIDEVYATKTKRLHDEL